MTAISAIDKQIDAVRGELRRREKIRPLSVAGWQRAWDRHPDLREAERDLFLQRGLAQFERDLRSAKDLAQAVRRKRRIVCKPTLCPACGRPLSTITRKEITP